MSDVICKELRRELFEAASAAAVVKIVRHNLRRAWHEHWGADALYYIARRSTTSTCTKWACDSDVMELAERLKKVMETDAYDGLEYFGVLLNGLEGLRLMGFQEPEDQRQVLQRSISKIHFTRCSYKSVKDLARFVWLAAPAHVEGLQSVLQEVRRQQSKLEGADVVLVVDAMRNRTLKSCELSLLHTATARLRVDHVVSPLKATDLLKLIEGLLETGTQDEEATRVLGRNLLTRRNELQPHELQHFIRCFQKTGVSLENVWGHVGAQTKRKGSEVVTLQTFATQVGHEKRRRETHDVERTSPPRIVQDVKQSSF